MMPMRLLHALLLILVLFSTAACLPSVPPPVVTGVLHGAQRWSGEVLVGGDVVLAPDSLLTIQPGTRIRFLPPPGFPGGLTEHPHFPGSELIIKGRLFAEGTQTAPIVFEAADDAAPPGSWGALNFEDGAEGIFSHCVFRQADSAIHSRDSSVSVEESLFERNLVGLRFHSSVILARHNLLRNNDTAVRFHFGKPSVSSNRFEGNRVNLFVTAHPRDYHFENNFFGIPLEYQVVLGEEVVEDFKMAGNYWEEGIADEVLVKVFDGHLSPDLGKLRLLPMLPVIPGSVGPSWIR